MAMLNNQRVSHLRNLRDHKNIKTRLPIICQFPILIPFCPPAPRLLIEDPKTWGTERHRDDGRIGRQHQNLGGGAAMSCSYPPVMTNIAMVVLWIAMDNEP